MVTAPDGGTASVGAPTLAPPATGWGLFFDVDGTLVEIAERPDAVRLLPGTIALLTELDRITRGGVALVSGRTIGDLDRIFTPLRLPAAGIHGLQRRGADGTVTEPASVAELDGARDRFRELVAASPGVELEDKVWTLAVHYRRAPEHEPAVRRLAQDIVTGLGPEFEILSGKMIVELRPRGTDKGTAVTAFMGAPPFAGRRPVFVGDDVTDEDAFETVTAHGGMAVLVGPGRPTAAQWRIATVGELHVWLRAVLARFSTVEPEEEA